MLIKMRQSPRDITHNLLEDVTVKGFCPLYQNRSPFGALNNHKNLKLLNILHYSLAPNLTRIEFEAMLFDLRIQIENHLLLNWMAVQEEAWHKLWIFIQTLDYPNILLEIDRIPSLIWSLQQDDYENILHYSVKEDNIGLTALICNHPRLSSCIQFNQTDRLENTAMHIAARSVKIQQLLHLVKVPAVDIFQVNREGCTILHLLLISIEMQRSNRISLLSKDFYLAINTILSRAPATATTIDKFDRSPIGIAISIGDSVLLQLLLTASLKGGFLNSTIYFREAICTNSAPIVSVLGKTFSSDFTITKSDQFEKKFSDIITIAVTQQKLKSLHTLLSMRSFAAHINIRNSFGITPLQASLELKDDLSLPILSCLLYYGSNVCQVLTVVPEEANNRSLDNVFSFAAYYGMSMALRLLVDYIPKNYIITLPFSILARSPDEPSYYFGSNQFYSNPLIAVSQSGDITCLQLLLQMKIFHSIINFQDKSTLTPLSAACASGRVEIVKLLLEAGANRWALIDNRNSVMNDKEQQSLQHIRLHTNKLHILELEINEFRRQQRISVADIRSSANRIHNIRSTNTALTEDVLEHLSSVTKEDMNSFAKDVISFAIIHRNFFNLLTDILRDLYRLFADFSICKIDQLVKINMNSNKEDINWIKILERPSVLYEDLIEIMRSFTEARNSESRKVIESTRMESLQKKFGHILSMQERIVSGKIGKKVFPPIYLWCKCILSILEQQQEMNEDPTYDIGSKYLEMQHYKSSLESDLSSVLFVPSYITCYNFITQSRSSYPGFKYTDSRSCDIYHTLSHSQLSNDIQTPRPAVVNDACSNSCLATTTSSRSIEKSLLEEVASLSDWALLSLLITSSEGLDWESARSIAEVVELVAREGPLSVLLDLIRHGVSFNSMATVLPAALHRIDPAIFITLVVVGSNFEEDNNICSGRRLHSYSDNSTIERKLATNEGSKVSPWAKYLKENQTRKIFHNLQFSNLGATATSGIFSPLQSRRQSTCQWKAEESLTLNSRSILLSELLIILKESNPMEQEQEQSSLLPSWGSSKFALDGDDNHALYTTVRKITFNNCDFIAFPSFTSVGNKDSHDCSNSFKYFLLCQTFNSIYSNLILSAEIRGPPQKPCEDGEKKRTHNSNSNSNSLKVLGVLGVHGEVLQRKDIGTTTGAAVNEEEEEEVEDNNAVSGATISTEVGNVAEVPLRLLMDHFLQLPPPPCSANLFLPLSSSFLTSVAGAGSAAAISSILPALQAMGSCCGNVLCTDSKDMAMVAAGAGNLDALRVILEAVSSCTRPSTSTTCCCRLSCTSQRTLKQTPTRFTRHRIGPSLEVVTEEVNVNVFLKKIVVDNERRLRISERRLQAYNKLQSQASDIFESMLALMRATCDLIDLGSALEVPKPPTGEGHSSARFTTTELREGRLYQLLQMCDIKLTSSFFDFSNHLLKNPLRVFEELLDKLEISNSSSGSDSDASLLFNYPLQVNISPTTATLSTKAKNIDFLSSQISKTKSSALLPPLLVERLSRVPDVWWRWLVAWEHLLCMDGRENLTSLLRSLEDHSLKKRKCSEKDVHSKGIPTKKWLYSVESDVVETFQRRRVRSVLVSFSSLIKSNLSAFENSSHSPTSTTDDIASRYPVSGWVSACVLPLLCLDGLVVREVLEGRNSDDSGGNQLASHLCQVYKIIRDSFPQTAAPARSLNLASDWSMVSSYSYVANLTTLLGCHSSLSSCAVSGEILELLHVILQEVEELLTAAGTATSDGPFTRYQVTEVVHLQTCKHLYVVAKAWCNIQSFRISTSPSPSHQPLLMKWTDLFTRGVFRVAPDTNTDTGSHGNRGSWMTSLLLQAAKSGSKGTFQYTLQWIAERSVVSSRMLLPAAIVAAAKGRWDVWKGIQESGRLDINDSNDGWSSLHAVLTGCVKAEDALRSLNTGMGLPGQGLEILKGSTVWNVGGFSLSTSDNSETNSHRLRITEDIMSNPGFDCHLHTSFGMGYLSSASHVASFPFPISLLDLASIRGYWDVVKCFITNGILLGMREVNHCFALHRAMLEGRIEVLEVLQDFLLQPQRRRDESPLAYLNALGTTRRLLLSRRTFRYDFPIAAAAAINNNSLKQEGLERDTVGITGNNDDSDVATSPSTTITHSLLHDALYHNNEKYATRLLRFTILVLSEFARDCNGGVDSTSILRGYHDNGLVYYAAYFNMCEFLIELKKYKDITSTVVVPLALPFPRLSTTPRTALEISCMRRNYSIFQIFFEIYMKMNSLAVTSDIYPVVNALAGHGPKSSSLPLSILDMQIKQLFVLAVENQSDEIASHLLSVLLLLEESSENHTERDNDNAYHREDNLANHAIVDWLRDCYIYNTPLLPYCSQSGLKLTLQKLLQIDSLIVCDRKNVFSELLGMTTALGQSETSKVLLSYLMRGKPDGSTEPGVEVIPTPFPISINLMDIPVSTFWKLVEFLWLRGKETPSRKSGRSRKTSTLSAPKQETDGEPNSEKKKSMAIPPTINENTNRPDNPMLVLPVEGGSGSESVEERGAPGNSIPSLSMTSSNDKKYFDSSSIPSFLTGTFPPAGATLPLSVTAEPYSLMKEYESLLSTAPPPPPPPPIPVISDCSTSAAVTKITRMVIIKSGGKRRVLRTTS